MTLNTSKKNIVITGAAGQIAYQLLFRIANGELLGKDTPVEIRLLGLPEHLLQLQAIAMELEDLACPLLRGIRLGSDPFTLFEGADYVFLIGAKTSFDSATWPATLEENKRSFALQGKALNEVASKKVLILTVANPCNTLARVVMQNAPELPRKNFHALVQLDDSRARSFLAKKAQVSISSLSSIPIWGNHSSKVVPDFLNARMNGRPLTDVFERSFLENDFFSFVRNRGQEVTANRKGISSCASAAHAALEAMRALIFPTAVGSSFSTACCSDGNPYGIAEDLIFSFPCRTPSHGDYEILPNLKWDGFLEARIRESENELLTER
ncbi:MAG: malate dehydrogenase [Chlamydiales bacterium]|jgi:malate dehydrogenase